MAEFIATLLNGGKKAIIYLMLIFDVTQIDRKLESMQFVVRNGDSRISVKEWRFIAGGW